MTKKLFLAAASVAALAFAGAAQAGDISGYFGTDVAGNKFAAATSTVPALSYLVAAEKIVNAANPAAGTIFAANTLETPITVGAGSADRDYLVAFTISGATVASAGLALNNDSRATVLPIVPGPLNPANTATLVSNINGVVTYLVTVPAGESVTTFQLAADVEQEAQAPITVSSTVTAVIGGSNILVDSAASVIAAKYQGFLAPLSSTANTWQAKLAVAPATADYVLIGAVGAAGATGQTLASTFKVAGATPLADFNVDLDGANLTLAGLLGTAKLTVTGPAINDDIAVTFSTAMTDANTASTPANTQIFDLTAGENQTFAAGGTNLGINNATGDSEYAAGDYTVTWSTKIGAGFTVPAASTTSAGTITLEGTNFVAPWVSGTGAATSVIRVSNANGSASVPVTVRMISGTQVVNGVASTFTSTAAPLVIGTVPANGDLQVTSAQLTAHFGAFTRGDFRVTINQPEAGLVAKLRNTRDGVTFEQSLAD